MSDFLFASSFLIFPFLALWAMRTIGLSIFKFSIPSFVVLSLFAFTYLGILPLYFQWDPYRFNSGVDDQRVVMEMFVYEAWTIMLMIVGFLLAKVVLRDRAGFHDIVPLRPFGPMESYLVFLALIACVGVLVLYLSQVPQIAIFSVFDGLDHLLLAEARSNMGNAFVGKYHHYSVFMHDLLNLITFALFANALVTRRLTHYLYFVVVFGVAAFSAVMALEKAPFVWLLIGLFLAYALVARRGTFPALTILKSTLILVLVLLVFYTYFMSAVDVESALISILSRITTGGITPAYYYLEFIPAHHEFLWGKSFPNPGGIFSFEPYLLPVEVSRWKFPELAEQGIVGSAPTVFWAELYANFGVAGVIIGPLYVGIFLYVLAFFVDKLENNPLKVAFIVWLAIHFQTLSQTGLSTFLVDTYLFVVVVAVMLIVGISHGGRMKLLRTAA